MHPFDISDIQTYSQYLCEQERSSATITKYLRMLERFYVWLPEGKNVNKATVISFKQDLAKTHAPAGVNTYLAALNGFFRFMGWQDCAVKALQIQRRAFSAPETELSREEYLRLVNAAKEKQDLRLTLLLQLIASTGIRVSEIRFVTVEAVECGSVQIQLKGKIRTILLPRKLCRKLKAYRNQCGILSGPIFLTRKGRPMDRREIWAQMKRLCVTAKVDDRKVFPHNLRHLFARTFYQVQKDIVKLADVLGHSSIETTRIYLLSSGKEHQRLLERLHLIC